MGKGKFELWMCVLCKPAKGLPFANEPAVVGTFTSEDEAHEMADRIIEFVDRIRREKEEGND